MSSRHSWEDRDWSSEEGSGSEEEEGEPPVGAGAGDQLVAFLLHLYFAGLGLSARSLCLVCYWAARAGAAGAVTRFAFRPNAPTGHYQRHLDSVLLVRTRGDAYYKIGVPMHLKHELGRRVRDTPVQVPHEVLDAEARATEGLGEKLAAAGENHEWSELYHSHPVVREAGPAATLPIALYLDGIRFLKRESLLGVFLLQPDHPRAPPRGSPATEHDVPLWLPRVVLAACHLAVPQMVHKCRRDRRVSGGAARRPANGRKVRQEL